MKRGRASTGHTQDAPVAGRPRPARPGHPVPRWRADRATQHPWGAGAERAPSARARRCRHAGPGPRHPAGRCVRPGVLAPGCGQPGAAPPALERDAQTAEGRPRPGPGSQDPDPLPAAEGARRGPPLRSCPRGCWARAPPAEGSARSRVGCPGTLQCPCQPPPGPEPGLLWQSPGLPEALAHYAGRRAPGTWAREQSSPPTGRRALTVTRTKVTAAGHV